MPQKVPRSPCRSASRPWNRPRRWEEAEARPRPRPAKALEELEKVKAESLGAQTSGPTPPPQERSAPSQGEGARKRRQPRKGERAGCRKWFGSCQRGAGGPREGGDVRTPRSEDVIWASWKGESSPIGAKSRHKWSWYRGEVYRDLPLAAKAYLRRPDAFKTRPLCQPALGKATHSWLKKKMKSYEIL